MCIHVLHKYIYIYINIIYIYITCTLELACRSQATLASEQGRSTIGPSVDGQLVFLCMLSSLYIFDCDLTTVALACCDLQSHPHAEGLLEIFPWLWRLFGRSWAALGACVIYLPKTFGHLWTVLGHSRGLLGWSSVAPKAMLEFL